MNFCGFLFTPAIKPIGKLVFTFLFNLGLGKENVNFPNPTNMYFRYNNGQFETMLIIMQLRVATQVLTD